MTIHHQIAIRAPRSAVYRAIAEPAQIVFELSSGDSGATMVERACSPAPIAELTTVDFRQTDYDLRGRFAGFNNSAWGQVLQSLKAACEAKAA